MTYAIPDEARTDEVNGKGHGFVDIFALPGHCLRTSREVANSILRGGSRSLRRTSDRSDNLFLIGNFGDGRIDAYDPTGKFVSTLNGKNGRADRQPWTVGAQLWRWDHHPPHHRAAIHCGLAVVRACAADDASCAIPLFSFKHFDDLVEVQK